MKTVRLLGKGPECKARTISIWCCWIGDGAIVLAGKGLKFYILMLTRTLSSTLSHVSEFDLVSSQRQDPMWKKFCQERSSESIAWDAEADFGRFLRFHRCTPLAWWHGGVPLVSEVGGFWCEMFFSCISSSRPVKTNTATWGFVHRLDRDTSGLLLRAKLKPQTPHVNLQVILQ